MSLVWLKQLFTNSRRRDSADRLPVSRQNSSNSYTKADMPKPDSRTPLLQHTSHTVPEPIRPAGSRTSTANTLTQYQSALSHHSSHSHPHTNGYSQPYQNLRDVESQSSRSSSPSGSSSKRPWWKVDARVISDATIGLSDGLTVPFALTAGLSALGNTKVVIYGGLAELIAGAISMGLGGYLGAKSELASYNATKSETVDLIATEPGTIKDQLADIFRPYDLPPTTLDDLTLHLSKSPHLIDFFMRFQHSLPPPASNRALTSALTIAGGYFFGGLLPLLPYFFVDKVYEALWISVGVMVCALFWFGYVKTCVVVGWRGGERVWEGTVGGVQMVVVGGAAAAAAMGLVWLFNSQE